MKTLPLFSVPQETRQTASVQLQSQENTPDRTRALGDSVTHVHNRGHRHSLPDAVEVSGAATPAAQNQDRFRLSEGTTAGISAAEDTESPRSPTTAASNTPPAPNSSPSFPPVNVLSEDYISPEQWMEKLVPKPLSSPVLKNDDWLAWLGSKHGERKAPDCVGKSDPLTYITHQLEERRRVEAAGEEFRFKPLLTTLANMQTFVRHIREGKQFSGNLTTEEDQALAWVDKEAGILLKEGAPYKASVLLAMYFMLLNDRITITHRPKPSPEQARHLAKDRWRRLTKYFEPLHKRTSPLSLTRLYWGGNNPGAPDAKDRIFSKEDNQQLERALKLLPEEPGMLLFPSFEPLSVAQFCRFGHLPLYPVGMTTDYAALADGDIWSPAAFMTHDLEHALIQRGLNNQPLDKSLRKVPYPRPWTWAESALYEPEQRLALRSLLLDQTPAHLTALKLEPALELLLFDWFHEAPREKAVTDLNPQLFSHNATPTPEGDAGEVTPFLSCLCKLTLIRRNRRHYYSPVYQSITDTQALQAALWATRVWQLWKRADFHPLPSGSLDDCARDFLENDVPRLDKHTAFIKQHRMWLLLALDRYCKEGTDSSRAFAQSLKTPLFKPYDEASGLKNRDYTDIAYFAALHQTGLRQRMEEATGATLPPWTPGHP